VVMMLTPASTSFAYEETTIPPGVTLVDWRRREASRTARGIGARLRLRPPRRRSARGGEPGGKGR
jgi:hypothetical protein